MLLAIHHRIESEFSLSTVVNYLNLKGLKSRGAARGQVMGYPISVIPLLYASIVDLDEAYKVGQKAV